MNKAARRPRTKPQDLPPEIADLYRGGMTGPKIADLFETSTSNLMHALKLRGVEIRNQGSRPRTLPDSVAEEYQRGDGIQKLARRYHAATPRISEHLRALGVTLRDHNEATRKVEHHDYPKIRELKAAGQSLRDIATVYGVTRERIRQILLK